MAKHFYFSILFLFLLFNSRDISAQQIKLKGSVKNSITNEMVSAVSILVSGGPEGTFTDDKGNFELTMKGRLPVTLLITSIGYEKQEIVVTDNTQIIEVSFKPQIIMGQELVILATRVPTRILESPVSIERIGTKTIQSAAAPSYYDALASLKGVDIVTSGLNFKTPGTRGFNGSGNVRFNQIVDGMGNNTPGLNFSVAAISGLTELDVESMELLPGASSALYGAGGMNGTLLINSKSPFKYQGLSFLVKEGIMHMGSKRQRDPSAYHNWSLRWGKKLSEKFAFKINAELIQAKDWLANDSSNYLRKSGRGNEKAGNRVTDPNYDGVNLYGDETTVDIRAFIPPGNPLLASPQMVSRTGYPEKDMISPSTYNFKLSGALHYKITDKLEAQLMGYWGTGNTVYTGTDRYSYKGIKIGQYKLEFKGPKWFMRVYTTRVSAGETYNATVTARIFNESWKPSFNPANISGSWYPQYTGALLGAMQQGASLADAHNIARAFADQGRPAAGSAQFKTLFDMIRGKPISDGGGMFIDKSKVWMAEGQYDLSGKIKFADILVGGSIKQYLLNSGGTIFIDTNGVIKIYEIGAYVQASKKFLDDRVTLYASGRFDKNENFKSKLTPRITALIKIVKNSNLRFSYQTAYLFPTAVQQFIKLGVGSGAILLGGLPWITDYMRLSNNPVSQVYPDGTTSSTPYQYREFKPETCRSFEAGFKGLIKNKLLIDAYVYFSSYKDFIGRITLYQPSTNKTYSPNANSDDSKVRTHGFGIGLDYRLPGNYAATFNFFSDRITNVPTGFVSFFNSPKSRVNMGVSNSGFGNKQRWSFNVQWRWQDAFYYESYFTEGNVAAFSTIDAQVGYKLLASKFRIKLGGTNILNHYYRNAYGNPYVGALYYLSFGYNVF